MNESSSVPQGVDALLRATVNQLINSEQQSDPAEASLGAKVLKSLSAFKLFSLFAWFSATMVDPPVKAPVHTFE